MSKKHWMIRTHDHHLLGPVSKDKIEALLLDKAFHPLDELCEGNGTWFYIRDGEMLKHNFPLHDQEQESNPVEAHDSEEATKEMALPQEVFKEPKKRCYYPLFLLLMAIFLCALFFLLYLLSFLFYK